MLPITVTELLHILNFEGKSFSDPKKPFLVRDLSVWHSLDKSYKYSFVQAEEDCTEAITLDKKVNFLLTQKHVSLVRTLFLPLNVNKRKIVNLFQNVKAYLRRGTAREMLGYDKEAIGGKL